MTNYFKKTDPIFDKFLRSAKAIESDQLLQDIKTSTLEELSAEIHVDPDMLAGVRAWIKEASLLKNPKLPDQIKDKPEGFA